MAQYLLSVYQPDGPAPAPEFLEPIMRDVEALNREMEEAGAWVFGAGLHPAESATVVRPQGTEVLITDGPFAEAKEHLGGFTVVDVPDDEAARHWAGRLAVSLDWPQEVHRFPSDLSEIIERQSP